MLSGGGILGVCCVEMEVTEAGGKGNKFPPLPLLTTYLISTEQSIHVSNADGMSRSSTAEKTEIVFRETRLSS
jgi:hypothetical protein